MKRMLRIMGVLVIGAVALGIGQGCVVQGTVHLSRGADGVWKATSVDIPWGDVSPKAVEKLEDRMNGK
jgi:hypothetical protein